MRSVGLHLRLNSTMVDLARQALDFNLSIFQCFCILQSTHRILKPTEDDIAQFLALRPLFKQLYLHGSYWINLARDQSNALSILEREVRFAKRHQFTHIIIHPGSAVAGTKKMDAIATVARMLNAICKKESDIYFVLENTTHAKMTVGSNIEDFGHVLQNLEFPERVGFCIDTAHAYEYGYTLNTAAGIDQFIALLDRTIGFANIMLLHINDTNQAKGSRIDHHAVLGEGQLGLEWLRYFSTTDALANIPIILELPHILSLERQQEMLTIVNNWQK